MTTQTENLLDGLLSEINRVEEIIKEYKAVPKNAGMLAASFMELDISKAKQAISNGDTIQMISSYKALKEYEC